MPDLEELDLADAQLPDALRALAGIEWRSQMADRGGYHAAVIDLIAAVEPDLVPLWTKVRDKAHAICARLYPDAEAECIVEYTLWQVALVNHSAIRRKVAPGTRMYLGRGWRRWLEERALSS